MRRLKLIENLRDAVECLLRRCFVAEEFAKLLALLVRVWWVPLDWNWLSIEKVYHMISKEKALNTQHEIYPKRLREIAEDIIDDKNASFRAAVASGITFQAIDLTP